MDDTVCGPERLDVSLIGRVRSYHSPVAGQKYHQAAGLKPERGHILEPLPLSRHPGGLSPQYTSSRLVYVIASAVRASLNRRSNEEWTLPTVPMAVRGSLSQSWQDGTGWRLEGTKKAPARALLQQWATQARRTETTRAGFDTRYPQQTYLGTRTASPDSISHQRGRDRQAHPLPSIEVDLIPLDGDEESFNSGSRKWASQCCVVIRMPGVPASIVWSCRQPGSCVSCIYDPHSQPFISNPSAGEPNFL